MRVLVDGVWEKRFCVLHRDKLSTYKGKGGQESSVSRVTIFVNVRSPISPDELPPKYASVFFPLLFIR